MLRELLPAYMIPTQWLQLDRLPKNVNGKIDRPRLREAMRQRIEQPDGDAGRGDGRGLSHTARAT
jgi:acyl-coenzyme A synthetase/AMP-(fatty) acid ligase